MKVAIERQGQWHKWFAWYPVKTRSHWVWLEYVERVKSATGTEYLSL